MPHRIDLQSASVGQPNSTNVKLPISRQVSVGHPYSILPVASGSDVRSVSLRPVSPRQPHLIRPVALGRDVRSVSLRPVPLSAVPRCVNVIRLAAAPLTAPSFRPVGPVQTSSQNCSAVAPVQGGHFIRPVAPIHIRGTRQSTTSTENCIPVPIADPQKVGAVSDNLASELDEAPTFNRPSNLKQYGY